MSNLIKLLSIEIQILKEENIYLKDKIIRYEENDTIMSNFTNGCFNNIKFLQSEFEQLLINLKNTDPATFEKKTKALILLIERMSLIFSIQEKTFLWKKKSA